MCLWWDCSFWYWCWPDLCHGVFSWPHWTCVGPVPYPVQPLVGRNVYDFCLQGDDHSFHVQAAEVLSICAALQRHSVPDSVLSSLGEGLHFVEAAGGEIKIDILMGQDFYWGLMTPEIVRITPVLVVQHTIFGWVMPGLLPEDHSGPSVPVMLVFLISCCAVMSLNRYFASFVI